MPLTSVSFLRSCGIYRGKVVQALLTDPRGLSIMAIRALTGVGVEFIDRMLAELMTCKLVDSGWDSGYCYYRLTANGWLKAVMLERPCSSKDRMQACGA